ncbi:urease subunit alpha, partial [Pseudomonas syringae pv. actinidiae ICMP 19096]
EAKQALSVNFVNRLAVEADTATRLGLKKKLLPAFGTRTLRKSDMPHNDACPDIRVDPQTFDVYADGERLYCEPVSEVPLAQRYMLR